MGDRSRGPGIIAAAALLGAVVTLAGCAEPVEVGAARPSGDPLGLDPARDEIVNATSWPDACEFLSDDEITAILPQASAITREPTPVEVIDINLMGDGSQSGTAHAGACTYDIELPGSDVTSSIDVETVAVAHPKLIKQHFAEEKADAEDTAGDPPVVHGGELGADACYSTPAANTVDTYTCRSGPLMFTVWGQTFATFKDVAQDQTERHWQDRVLPEVIKTVAARVKPA
jgi:hypothetical protein